jgi:acetyl-CoA acetyltransferase
MSPGRPEPARGTSRPIRSSKARQRQLGGASGSAGGDTGTRQKVIGAAIQCILEAYGFCPHGEARDFIADGNIELGGRLPVNTNGGLLGGAYIHGVINILEGVRQLRGTAANQVEGAEHVLCGAGRSAVVLGKA